GTLIFQFSALYSRLEEAKDIGRRLQARTYGPEQFPAYVDAVVRAFYMTVHMDMRLKEQTKAIDNPDWGEVVVGQQDSEDHNWSVGILTRLEQQAAPRAPRPGP